MTESDGVLSASRSGSCDVRSAVKGGPLVKTETSELDSGDTERGWEDPLWRES